MVASAQNPEPVYRRYTINDGLPSSMVYHAFQDSKGYIWFATSNGVSRFDGYKFENFDLQSGLVDNDVFEIYEDYKHRIWFIPMSGKLCYYENGKISQFKYNDLIARHTKNTRGPVKGSFYVNTHDFVYLSMKFVSRFSISPEGVLRSFVNKENCGIEVFEIVKGKPLISFSGTYFSRVLRYDGIDDDFEIDYTKIFKSDDPRFIPFHIFFTHTNDRSIIMSVNSWLIKFKGDIVVDGRRSKNKTDILWVSPDKQNNFWISELSGGVQLIDFDKFNGEPILTLLENYKVTSVLSDNEGAYWFTTLNDGVFYYPNINVLKVKNSKEFADSRVNAVLANKDGVYIGYDFAYVDFLDRKWIVTYYKSPNYSVPKNTVRSFFEDSARNRIWVCSISNLSWIENGKVKAIGPPPFYNLFFPRRIILSRSGGYWIATTKGLAKCVDDVIIYKSENSSGFRELVYDLAEDYEQRVWLCTVRGIWTFSNGVFKFLGDEDSRYNQTCNSIISNPMDSSIWIGTNGDGIIISKGNKISKLTTKEGLVSNSITQLLYKSNSVWVATRNGLTRLILDGKKYAVKNYTILDGLPTNEVTSISEYRDTVYLGTPEGICYFNKNKIVECNNPPKITISKFSAKDKLVDLNLNHIEFNYHDNSFSIDFVGFVYRNAGKVNYRYRMLGLDSSWVYSQVPSCQYYGLEDGRYKFEVEAQSYNGIWSESPAAVEFIINPPFWKRIWFLLLLAISFSGLFFLIYRIRVSSIHRRNDLLQNINLYKQQSLRQQMNPHFIFNTLNSIQLYILEKDSISSHKYLTKFARLMRMTLDNSLFSTIPLKDELESLKLYLDLEKLRLEDKFDYTIEYGSDDSILNVEIPTLLIQPFVENAIWHGISLKKEQQGWLKISIIDNVNSLICIVEDNGVGRAMAEQIKNKQNKNHKSRGSQITQQRIDLLGQMYKEKFSVVYNDLFDNTGDSIGTRVTVTIPKDVKVKVNK
ncbi:MAG TPA: hypothetical protein DIW31_04600 [Bacteroidales bacterium]|nr:hypothetical protein [Bacteroidales bacterium]